MNAGGLDLSVMSKGHQGKRGIAGKAEKLETEMECSPISRKTSLFFTFWNRSKKLIRWLSIENMSTFFSRKVRNTNQSNIIDQIILALNISFFALFCFVVFILLKVIFLYFQHRPFLDLSHRLRRLFRTKCNLFPAWSTSGISTLLFPPFPQCSYF